MRSRLKVSLAAVAAMFILPQAVSAQVYYDPGRRFDDGGRYYDDRGRGRDDGYRRDDRYRRGRGQLCASEGGFCAFRGEATVRYGARGQFVARRARDGIPCNNRVFGDPAVGLPKNCFID